MTKKSIIELRNVWKTYRMGDLSLDVLKDINLIINEGEFVAILGPSGSGKSTMMNQIGLLDTPTKGQIIVASKNISTLDDSELATLRGRTIGFIFQQFNLIPTLTAVENVILPTIFQNMPEQQRFQKAQQLLSKVGLADRLHHKPTELSGGQQQRVSIARALINNPEIILADEPTGNLDSTSGRQVMGLLTEFHQQQGKTVVLITHDIDLVHSADKTVFLKDGEIVKTK